MQNSEPADDAEALDLRHVVMAHGWQWVYAVYIYGKCLLTTHWCERTLSLL